MGKIQEFESNIDVVEVEKFRKSMCGMSVLGENYNIDYCDNSCNTKDDCKDTCGCGAININENCEIGDTKFDCVQQSFDCIYNKCVYN